MTAPAEGYDEYPLFDLRVKVIWDGKGTIQCGAKPGDYFDLHGEMLYLPPGQGFSIYSLAAVLPLLAAKQRVVDPKDWMATDAEVACPDPRCTTRFRIERTGIRRFRWANDTIVSVGVEPLPHA